MEILAGAESCGVAERKEDPVSGPVHALCVQDCLPFRHPMMWMHKRPRPPFIAIVEKGKLKDLALRWAAVHVGHPRKPDHYLWPGFRARISRDTVPAAREGAWPAA